MIKYLNPFLFPLLQPELKMSSLLKMLVLLQVLLLSVGIKALPTIQQQAAHSGANYVQQLDKTFFQPPDIEQTIDEVQKILANDPALPRLTR